MLAGEHPPAQMAEELLLLTLLIEGLILGSSSSPRPNRPFTRSCWKAGCEITSTCRPNPGKAAQPLTAVTKGSRFL